MRACHKRCLEVKFSFQKQVLGINFELYLIPTPFVSFFGGGGRPSLASFKRGQGYRAHWRPRHGEVRYHRVQNPEEWKRKPE